jgi:hypothetical protein
MLTQQLQSSSMTSKPNELQLEEASDKATDYHPLYSFLQLKALQKQFDKIEHTMVYQSPIAPTDWALSLMTQS